jgi:CHRD domain
MAPEELQGAGGVSRRKMLQRIGAGVAVAWTAPIITSLKVPAFAQSPTCHLVAKMDGAQESPPVPTPGTGTADFVRTSPTELTYTYTYQDLLGNAQAAHIHRAPPGVPGPIVVPLTPPPGGHEGSVSDVATAEEALLDEICGAPGEFYINVHSDMFPGGEIRGQLQT